MKQYLLQTLLGILLVCQSYESKSLLFKKLAERSLVGSRISNATAAITESRDQNITSGIERPSYGKRHRPWTFYRARGLNLNSQTNHTNVTTHRLYKRQQIAHSAGLKRTTAERILRNNYDFNYFYPASYFNIDYQYGHYPFRTDYYYYDYYHG